MLLREWVSIMATPAVSRDKSPDKKPRPQTCMVCLCILISSVELRGYVSLPIQFGASTIFWYICHTCVTVNCAHIDFECRLSSGSGKTETKEWQMCAPRACDTLDRYRKAYMRLLPVLAGLEFWNGDCWSSSGCRDCWRTWYIMRRSLESLGAEGHCLCLSLFRVEHGEADRWIACRRSGRSGNTGI